MLYVTQFTAVVFTLDYSKWEEAFTKYEGRHVRILFEEEPESYWTLFTLTEENFKDNSFTLKGEVLNDNHGEMFDVEVELEKEYLLVVHDKNRPMGNIVFKEYTYRIMK